jgi:hypothetical protein
VAIEAQIGSSSVCSVAGDAHADTTAPRDQVYELLVISAAATVAIVRLGLHLTGYPQIGTRSLHIAHLLWGGLLMFGANVVLLRSAGRRWVWQCALMAGVGFGLFIDELGKFVTADNNYFFRPALSLIYLCFALLFVLRRPLAERAGQPEGRPVRPYQGIPRSSLDRCERLRQRVQRLLARSSLRWILIVAFVLQAIAYLATVALVATLELSGTPREITPIESGALAAVVAAVAATLIYGGLVVAGAVCLLRAGPHRAFVWFRRATVWNLLTVQPFHIYSGQLQAWSGLALNMVGYVVLSAILSGEPSSRRAGESAAAA